MPNLSQATVIQILHTNDLHASISTSGAPLVAGQNEYGGWAQLKSLMNELTKTATERGIETIKLDAGDYTEGTLAYFGDHGANVLKAFQDIGYDAAAFGNHDWLMGARDLDALYGAAPFPFPILSANTKISSDLPHLKSQIIPSTQITTKSGVKIGIFGLSTNEALYSWIPGGIHSATLSGRSGVKDLSLHNYLDDVIEDAVYNEPSVITGVANKMIGSLRQQNDLVIALTHIGFAADKILAAGTRGLDLIVGGHSHTVLEDNVLIKDRDGKDIPIVQTGFNGNYIGQILLDVDPKKTPSVRLISYKLVPVHHDGPQDPLVAADVARAEEKSKAALAPANENRLDETIGTSPVRLISGDSGPTAFSKFAVDSMREITGTQIAFDVGAFHGNTPQAAGNITRRKLMEMYPRKFEADQNEGLYVYEARVPGALIKMALKFAMEFGMYISTSGITFEVAKLNEVEFKRLKGKYFGTSSYAAVTPYYPKNIMIGNEPVQNLKWYSASAPESLVRGGFGISSIFKLVVRNSHPTSHTIWDAMNFNLLKIHTIEKLELQDHYNIKEFTKSDQDHYGAHHNLNQLAEGEGFIVPWINEFGSAGEVINNSLVEMVKQVGVKQLNRSAEILGTPAPSRHN